MSALPTPLRRQLDRAIQDARKIAKTGARKALEALAVHEPEPYGTMDETQRGLRRKLRAQARQLGDGESQSARGAHEIRHLVEKLAYDQWHRILFARYLIENNLLISPEHGVSVSLSDCEELAPSLGLKDAWSVAARFAAKELPEIFRSDDPAGAVELAVEDRKPLIQLVTGLPVEVFIAGDSLGWCYQFWQAEEKEAVNKSGKKIGADELPAVTQLFTEDYMVDFLLDNTLGAWHAGKVFAAKPSLAETAQNEDELRNAVALPGVTWGYLRFIKGDDAKWKPAAGIFDGWPKQAKDLKCLDPCMGSGHFIVAMFERLVALRVAEEQLDETSAVAAVIRDNLFGLEIDPRCTQIAAFNQALAAWRRVGYCTLPPMNLACSGLAPNASESDWLAIAGDDGKLRNGMTRLYRLFEDAPVLGSLINPRFSDSALLSATFHELQPLLEKAMDQEATDDTAHEMAVTARGIAKAAEVLATQFTLVATNVPYLSRGNQEKVLMDYCARVHEDAKADLATCFLEASVALCASGGSVALVTPQNWNFLGTYTQLREDLLRQMSWNYLARLGPHAFETIGGEVVNVALTSFSRQQPNLDHQLTGIVTTEEKTPVEKARALRTKPVQSVNQRSQRQNPDSRITLEDGGQAELLSTLAHGVHGLGSKDSPCFFRQFWEVAFLGRDWEFLQTTVEQTQHFGGMEQIVFWEQGQGLLHERGQRGEAILVGGMAWKKRGVIVSQMNKLCASLYLGNIFDKNAAVVLPFDDTHTPAIWAFCSSLQYNEAVRKIDQKVNVTNVTLVKVPFNLAQWQKIAAEMYPNGLPKPFSSDPTQWLFNGHPKGADNPLHVAVARLLGYQWPRQTGSSFPDCPALSPDGLEDLADADGIVCLSSTKGEPPGAERLRELIARAWGSEWNSAVLEDLLTKAGYSGKTLDDWLRNGFFEQHCALFHHRPFIWHIWDGHKNGFNALVNYHQLTHANLEKLTYAYLGDWIRRQQAAVDAGEAGSDARLQAAKQLQARLKLILEGEPPYDIFVRWKPLPKQAIGWNPDLNDGVRMNIRPFATADVLRKRVKIKWEKDRGKEPVRDKDEYPWFWCAAEPGTDPKPDTEFSGNRWNDVHLTKAIKESARKV